MNGGGFDKAFLAAVSVAVSATLVLTFAVLRAAPAIFSLGSNQRGNIAQVLQSTVSSGDLMKLDSQTTISPTAPKPPPLETSATDVSSGGSGSVSSTNTDSPPPTYEYQKTIQTATLKESPTVIDTYKSTAADLQYIESQKVVSEGVITDEIQGGVVDSLYQAEKTVVDPATLEYIKQELRNTEKDALYDVSKKIQSAVPSIPSPDLDPVNQKASQTFTDFQMIIGKEARMNVEVEDRKRRIASEVDRLESILEQHAKLLSREGLLMYRDDDSDSVSNYDELYIYGTDPSVASTSNSGLSDGERILKGLDPTSRSPNPIQYEDPRAEGEVVKELYRVTEISIVPKEVTPEGEISSRRTVFRGKALPNSFVTLYVFSTPIIVTVKTDLAGEWVYELDYELPDGDHIMYVATVNNSGRILAKSSGVGFVKEAEAVTLLAAEDLEPTATRRTFFSAEFIPMAVGIASTGLLIAVVVLGYVSRKGDEPMSREKKRST